MLKIESFIVGDLLQTEQLEHALKALLPDAVLAFAIEVALRFSESQRGLRAEWQDGYETAVEDFYDALSALTVRHTRAGAVRELPND